MAVARPLWSPCEAQPDASQVTKEPGNCFSAVWLLIKGESTEVEAMSAPCLSVLGFYAECCVLSYSYVTFQSRKGVWVLK